MQEYDSMSYRKFHSNRLLRSNAKTFQLGLDNQALTHPRPLAQFVQPQIGGDDERLS